MLDVVAPGVSAPLVDAAEPREVPQNLLVERPEPPRADHRAVVEADRREGPSDLVRDAQDVEVEVPPDVLRLHVRALAQRLDAHAHVRDAVHAHHAVRAVAGTAEEPAVAVVLERAREGPQAGCIERRAHCVTLVALHRRLAETKGERPVAIDPLARLSSEPPVHERPFRLGVGSETDRTSFVRVSRSARNHSPQPVRCCHHSR